MIMKEEKQYFIHEPFVGAGDFLRPASILDLFQDTAALHARNLGIGYDDLLKLNLLWVVTNVEFELVGKLPKFGDEIIVKTWPLEKGKLEFKREYEITDLEGNLIIKGISSWFTIDAITHRLTKGDKVVYSGEYFNKTNYPDYKRFKIDTEVESSEVLEWQYKVLYTDLDHNNHMNNARYLDIIYNKRLLTNITELKRIKISYEHEILYDEIIDMKYIKNNKEHTFVGCVNGTECFTVLMEEK